MAEKINPVRRVDEEAISLARKLLAEARYAALAVKEPESDVPLVSRVAAAWSSDTGLFFSGSDLSIHSKCLVEDSTCSIMLGEPGKGDGLAHPRMTLIGSAARMGNEDHNRDLFRTVFVDIHPKAKMYIDFADFGFYPVLASRALLNGGFGKAYHFDLEDMSSLIG
ncbi:MAG: HugZ family protein [Pseudomonadota bacterium]